MSRNGHVMIALQKWHVIWPLFHLISLISHLSSDLRERARPPGKSLRLLDVGGMAGPRDRFEFRARYSRGKRAAIGFADQPIGGAPQHQRRNPDAVQPAL